MSSTFKNNISINIFGESHGPAVGVTLDGLPAGIKWDEEVIKAWLLRRKAQGLISTQRHETDEFELLSGVYKGYTTGTPITALFKNQDIKDSDYDDIIARPGHADYSGYVHYNGFNNPLGGGHFSGRLTAPLVFAGAVCSLYLKKFNIEIATHIEELHGIKDNTVTDVAEAIQTLHKRAFPTLSSQSEEEMKECILNAREMGDSVGGICETLALVPAGLGEPFFDSCESIISHLVFSVPAVKGIEFGEGFGFSRLYGSEANDSFYYDEKKSVKTKTNHNGGINGGITNGMPIVFRTVVKPTASIAKEQESITLNKAENMTMHVRGRHDPAIVHRATIVISAVTAIALCDLCLTRFGHQE